MPFLKTLTLKLGHILTLYGGWGLFAISFLDSSFIPFPLVNDLVLIVLAGQHPGRAWIYALQSAAGSVLGSFVFYGLARGGAKFLWRKSTPASVARARRWLERNDFVTLLVACVLPPPTPFKVIVLSAGILRVDPVRFGAALLLGRCLRFGADAWLGAHYGPQAEAYLKQNFVWASLVAAAVIVLATLLYRRLRRPRAPQSGNSAPPPPTLT